MKTLLSVFHCDPTGKSERYVGYQLARQVSRVSDATILTADPKAQALPDLNTIYIPRGFERSRKRAPQLFGVIKPDYFLFDRRAKRKLGRAILEFDVFHHAIPMSPRYPSRLGCMARSFVLGPVGGGLRVPESFRKAVESEEPWYAWLRQLDGFRLQFDPLLRKTFDHADVLLLAAEYMLDVLPERYHSKARILLETGIDPQEYTTISRVPPSSERVRLLYVGRIVPYKGLHYLLRSLSRQAVRNQNSWDLTIVGDYRNSYGTHCRREAARLGIDAKIEFVGPVAKSEVSYWYSRSDVFVFPTLAETSGNVLLEAMALGLPVVSTKYGGPAVIVDEASGILCDPLSPDRFIDSLASAIECLIENPDMRERMGRAARSRVLREFSWERKGDELKEIYSTLSG